MDLQKSYHKKDIVRLSIIHVSSGGCCGGLGVGERVKCIQVCELW